MARQRVNLFKSRFKEADESYFPIRMAIRWAETLEAQPLNVVELKQIAKTACERRNGFEIAFFTFCNHLESVCAEL